MSWATEEFATIDLGDKRLNARAIKVTEQLSQNSTESIPNACDGWPEINATYRFFDNAKVRLQKILHERVTYNRYYEKFSEFSRGVIGFLSE